MSQLPIKGVGIDPPDEYWWELTLRDGRVVPIPPQAVQHVRRKMDNREPIHAKAGSIPYAEIKGFDKTSRKVGEPEIPLLEEASKAFDEPIITQDEDGKDMVKARWVKKEVTRDEWGRFYARGSYHKLGDSEGGMVWVAFLMPAHKVDSSKHTYCTVDEIRLLTR